MADKFPILHTARLDLVEIRQEHLNDIYNLFNDSSVTQYYNVTTLNNEEEAQKYLDWFSSRFAEQAGIRWGISLKGKKNIIGTAGFNNFTKQHRANLGYDLQTAFWNKGYVTEALQAILQFGFTALEINRIEAEVMQGNTASEKVLTKLGFKNEGILRQWMHWNETYYDMTMFSLLRKEFFEGK
ncbi:MAG: GNAT family N-acetyltransferase [Ginsengibacter sp.]